MNCKDCITYTICRNKIITRMKEYRQFERREKRIHIGTPQNGIPILSNDSLIYKAYLECILPKCNLISKRASSIQIDKWKKELKMIRRSLNLSEEDYESM